MNARGRARQNGLNHVGTVSLYSLAQLQQLDEGVDQYDRSVQALRI